MRWTLSDGYAKLMSSIKNETAVHGCRCPGDVAVRMRKALATHCRGLVLGCFLFITNFLTNFLTVSRWAIDKNSTV